MPGDTLLIGEAAVRLGVPESALRRLCNAGVVTVPRVGRYRVFPVEQLPAIADAIRRTGFHAPGDRPGPDVPATPRS